jgi:hypothetical protein
LGLFTRKGFDWLRSLGLEPIDCYLRLIVVLNGEIRRLSRELKQLAGLDDDVRLLMTIPGVGYYTALLVKAEIGDVNRFRSAFAVMLVLFHPRIIVEVLLGMVGLRVRVAVGCVGLWLKQHNPH